MRKTKIAALDLRLGDAPLFVETLVTRWPEQVLVAQSSAEFLRIIQEFAVDVGVVHRGASRGDGLALWPQLATDQPALPLVVWGITQPTVPFAGRSAPVLFTDSFFTLEDFILAEAMRVTRGRLVGVSMASIAQMLHAERRSCRVRARFDQLNGELYIRNGELVHAAMRRLDPQHAALEMLSWTEADVVFDRLPNPEITTIRDTLPFLLLESARLLDEVRSSGVIISSKSVSSSASTPSFGWVPSVLRGDPRAVLDEVFALPGVRAAAIVDARQRATLAWKTVEQRRSSAAPDALCDQVQSLQRLCESLSASAAIDDAVLNQGPSFVLLQRLAAAPTSVLIASFDREATTIGLVRSRFVQLASGFALAAAETSAP